MTSDIDDLLDWMRFNEMINRDDSRAHGGPHALSKEADDIARWIAAVEELRESKSVVSFVTRLVEAEPELTGMMPVSLHKYSPEELCRATVRATKEGILARLRESIDDD